MTAAQELTVRRSPRKAVVAGVLTAAAAMVTAGLPATAATPGPTHDPVPTRAASAAPADRKSVV